MIELLTLGALDLRVRNGPPAASVLAQPKRTALLCYLALARPRGFHRRDALTTLFWPEQDAEHARTGLRQALYVLRRSLGEGAVLSRGDEEVAVPPEAVWCDAAAFEEAVRDGRAEQAVELYRGDLLVGFFIEGAPEFERWLAAEREYLRGRAAEAAWAVAEQRERMGDAVAAAEWGRRALALSPADETALRRLMLLLERTGDRAAALRAYEAFTRQLREDFDLEPSAETRALADAVRGGESPGAPAAPRPASRPTAPPWTAEDGEPSEGVAGAVPPEPVRSMAEPVSAKGGWQAPLQQALRRWPARAALIVLLVFGLGAAVYFSLRPLGIRAPRSLVAMGALEPQDQVLIGDFAAAGADTTVGELVTEAFRADLQRTRSVRVVAPDRVRNALERMLRDPSTPLDAALARELAEREGIAAVLEGTVGRVGAAYQLTARLVASPAGQVLAAFRQTAPDSSQLLDAIDRLSEQVRDRVGELLRQLRAEPPLERVTTASLPALRIYSRAVRMERTGDDVRQRVLLEEAVSLDTAFAAAYSRLGMLLISQGMRQRGVDALQRAYRYRDRLSETDRYLTIGLYHRQVTGDAEEAVSALRSALALAPENWRALHELGQLYNNARDWPQMEQVYERLIRIRQHDRLAHRALIDAEVAQGKMDQATASVARMGRLVPDTLGTAEVAAMLASVRGDYAPLERHARTVIARADLPFRQRMTAHRMLADLLLCQGRLAEAEREMEAQAAAAARLGLLGIALRNAARPALVDAIFRGDTAAGLRRADRALQRYPLAAIAPADRPYRVFAEGYAEAGATERARALLAQAKPLSTLEAGWAEGYAEAAALGRIALAERRTADALREARRYDATSACVLCGAILLGEAFDKAGERDSAIANYERYVTTPNLWRYTLDGLSLAPILEHLATLQEERGDREAAARTSARLIALWGKADRDLQPRVAVSRARLARLDPQGRIHVRLPLQP